MEYEYEIKKTIDPPSPPPKKKKGSFFWGGGVNFFHNLTFILRLGTQKLFWRYSWGSRDRKNFWGRTPTCRNFGQIGSQKFRFFGLKSAVFDSSNATEPKNELGIIKTFFRGLLDLFGAGRKHFDHPTPNRSILGVQKFLQNRIFWPNFSSFRLWWAYMVQKWVGWNQKVFARALEPLWGGPRKF